MREKKQAQLLCRRKRGFRASSSLPAWCCWKPTWTTRRGWCWATRRSGCSPWGALDVWHTPVQMKKNRPGVVLSALVPPRQEQAAVELILRETPTLGIRSRLVDRYVAHRHSVTIETGLGSVSVKVKTLEGSPVSAAPEPDDCRRIAIETGLPFQEVYQRVAEAARQQLLD